MQVAFGRTAVLALGMLVAVVLAGCAADPAGTSVPTFPEASLANGAMGGPAEPDDGAVPDDCARLLAVADLNALLGLPLDSVAVRTTRHVGAPSVGRTERVACEYTGQGAVRGRLLQVDASAYTDARAATAQWRINADTEDGTRTELAIGTASAVLVERRSETVLRVVHGTSNLAFVLPSRALPGGRAPGDVLVDLALRVIPAVDAGVEAPTPAPADPGSS